MNNTITLTSDRLTATIAPHGARLETLRLDGGASLVLHADPHAHPGWRSVYPGAIVGPIANRVAGGRCPVGTRIHQMPCNENGISALHSGPDGLDQVMWDVAEHGPHEACLTCTLADGAGGLPGTRTVAVRYSLEGSTLTVDISAVTDAPTPINIAHHPYWRLGDAGAHRLQVHAVDYLPVDARNIPTGAVAPVAGTPFDHRSPKALDPRVDHNFCIARETRDTEGKRETRGTEDKRETRGTEDKRETRGTEGKRAPRATEDPRETHDAPVLVATLWGAHGLRLDIRSTEPGLQVYAGAHLPTLPGTDIAPFAGIALEPQGWPDAVNQPAFPAILCSPGRPYRQITQYCIDAAS